MVEQMTNLSGQLMLEQAAEITSLKSQLFDLRSQLAECKKDAERLDWIAGEYIKVDSFSIHAGLDDDADSGWVFSQYHMGKPREREIYRHYRDNLRQAIDAAMEQKEEA